MTKIKHIIFVCTGNTCRSPMAEAYLKNILKKEKIVLKVSSAGLFASQASPANDKAIQICKSLGIKLDCHTSMQLTENLLNTVDTIIPMTSSHIHSIIDNFPQHAKKIEPFLDSHGAIVEIPDPFGGNIREYQNCMNTMIYLIDKLLNKWRKQ